jgi:hypothetical protein
MPWTWGTTARLAALLVVAAAPGTDAQPPNAPHVGYVYPAGGQEGTTFAVQVGGRFLESAATVLVSGRGVRASVVGYRKPLTPQQLADLREQVQGLETRGSDPTAQQELQELRLRIGDSVRRAANPVLAEVVALEVTIDKNAAPGPRFLRLATPRGVTNPLVFCVGQLPEVRDQDVQGGLPDAEMAITLPTVVNGRIVPGKGDRLRRLARQPTQYMPGDVDRYRFTARKGQDLVAEVVARRLMPYLADAVPGWFQATLALYDASGREVAYNDDFHAQPDPVLHYRVPADGSYVVEVKDALYRGREDFVYRLVIGEVPFVTGIFPLGGRVGAKTTVEVSGWNLPAAHLTVDARGAGVGTSWVSVRSGELVSNRVSFAVDRLPEVMGHEPNGTPAAAQALTLPVIVNGRLQEPGDVDVFSLSGRTGDQVVAEVTARRLGSPLDSTLELTDAQGRRLAFNDDHDDPGAGLLAHQADSFLMATLPATGTYFLRLGDAARKGGPDYAYRLRVSAPRPDFQIQVAPSGINASAGTAVPITVSVARRDGFSGDVALSLEGAPAGFVLSGAVVPAGHDVARMTLTVPPLPARAEPVGVLVEGRAVIQGRTVVRRAVPADEMMQAFASKHFVPAEGLRVAVLARGGVRAPARFLGPQPVGVPVGGHVRVRVELPPGLRAFENIEFELSEPPEGVTLRDVAVRQDIADFSLLADAAKTPAGLRTNIIIGVSGERVPGPKQRDKATRRRLPLLTLPALSIEVRPR